MFYIFLEHPARNPIQIQNLKRNLKESLQGTIFNKLNSVMAGLPHFCKRLSISPNEWNLIFFLDEIIDIIKFLPPNSCTVRLFSLLVSYLVYIYIFVNFSVLL